MNDRKEALEYIEDLMNINNLNSVDELLKHFKTKRQDIANFIATLECTPNACCRRTLGNCNLGKCIMEEEGQSPLSIRAILKLFLNYAAENKQDQSAYAVIDSFIKNHLNKEGQSPTATPQPEEGQEWKKRLAKAWGCKSIKEFDKGTQLTIKWIEKNVLSQSLQREKELQKRVERLIIERDKFEGGDSLKRSIMDKLEQQLSAANEEIERLKGMLQEANQRRELLDECLMQMKVALPDLEKHGSLISASYFKQILNSKIVAALTPTDTITK